MGFKEDFQREMRNIKADVAAEVDKRWLIEYDGHSIEIINQMLEEKLLVDGVVIAENIRKSLWSHVLPYTKLVGTFEGKSGAIHKVQVKLGGYFKFKCTVKINGQKYLTETVKLEFLPWKNKDPIISYIENQIDENGRLSSDDLPDDSYVYDENHPRLAPGLADQLADEPVLLMYVKKVVKLFVEQVENPSDKTRRATYEKVQEEKVISYFQDFLAYYLDKEIDRQKAQQEAIWLLEHGADREVVKFALVILGTTECDAYVERLKKLALHGEFTGVALFAIVNGTQNSNVAVFDVAQRVSKWGKLEALNFLEPTNEEIRQWLLTDGIKNTIRTSQAPLLCAVKGKLDIELHNDVITREVFDGASLLVEAFAVNAPLTSEYEYAGQVFMRYMKHAETHVETLQHFQTLIHIAHYMNVEEELWQNRYAENWRPHEREAVIQSMQRLIEQPKWLELANEILAEQPGDELAQDVLTFYREKIFI